MDQSANLVLSFNAFMGLCFAMLASLFFSISTIFLKKLNLYNIDYTFILSYTSYVGIPVTLFVSLFIRLFGIEKWPADILKDKWSLLYECFYMLFSASSSGITQFFLNLAIKYEDPAKVAIVRINDLLITFVLQAIFLNIYPNFFSKLGALIIFASTFLVILYRILNKKYENEQNATENRRTLTLKKIFFYKFWFFLVSNKRLRLCFKVKFWFDFVFEFLRFKYETTDLSMV